MKRFRIGTAALLACAICAPAAAADLPLKAPPAKPIPTISWAGLYVGAHFGYGYGVTSFNIPGFVNTKPFVGLGSKGFSGGGLAGYNIILAPRWVGGIEVDGSLEDFKTHITAVGGLDVSMSMDWSTSVRGRLGYLLTPTTMLFGSVGWTWSHFEFS